jgi:hypothetical protein
MNDKIIEFEVYNFGIILRRKTMIQGLVFTAACLLLCGTLEFQSLSTKAQETQIDRALTWDLFWQELRQGEGNHKAMWAFEDHWQGHTVQWTGSVLRVDSYDDKEDQDDDLVWIGDT